MNLLANTITCIVHKTNSAIVDALLKIDLFSLPTIEIRDVTSCDALPRGVPCLYFLHNTKFGLLYVGKAKCLRSRWRASGNKYMPRQVAHQHHARCIEIGGINLSWFALDEVAHEIAETNAIRVLRPAWNFRKNSLGHHDHLSPPPPYSEQPMTITNCHLQVNIGATLDSKGSGVIV